MTMKLNLTLLFSFFLALSLQAQIRKIPAGVTESFKSRYPHAERVSWKDDLRSFEAEFILNNYQMKANFDTDGDWLQSDRKMKYDELPGAIKDGYQKSKFTDWEVISVYEITKNMDPVQYRILVKKSGVQKKCLYFSADGKLTRESITL
jgi:hypothetical protein